MSKEENLKHPFH